MRHVLEATKYFAFLDLNMKIEADEIYKNIEFFELELGTLSGLKSVFWSKFHRFGREKSVDFARKALTEAPDCDAWHFILGKNLRRIRRDTSFGCKATQEEVDAFQKAYNISKNIVYGLFVAQAYREENQNNYSRSQKAIKLYQELYQTVSAQENPNIVILSRLALGFLRLQNLKLAEECLNKVEAQDPQDLMFLHYKGILCMKKKNHRVSI